MNKNNGLISFADFNTYEPYIRKPISTVYRGNKVYTAGPPSGGGITLLTALNILSHFDLAKYESNSLMTYHLFSEALRREYKLLAALQRGKGYQESTPFCKIK